MENGKMELIKGGSVATHQKIQLASETAQQDFKHGHLKSPYKHCKVLANAYNTAALRLLKRI